MAVSGSDFPLEPERRSSSFIATAIDKLVALCGVVPYALVALGLRFIIARVFFLSGQMKISGPEFPISLLGKSGDFSIVLPAEIKPATFELFQTQYAALPMPPTVAAYLFTYAEFVLPICLVLGFATRLSALALLAMTILIQVYVVPGCAVDGARVPVRDPDGADVGRAGRDLARRGDPLHLPEIVQSPVKRRPLWRPCVATARISACAPPRLAP